MSATPSSNVNGQVSPESPIRADASGPSKVEAARDQTRVPDYVRRAEEKEIRKRRAVMFRQEPVTQTVSANGAGGANDCGPASSSEPRSQIEVQTAQREVNGHKGGDGSHGPNEPPPIEDTVSASGAGGPVDRDPA